MEVPTFILRSKISPQIDFPNLGKQEGAPREYTSKKYVNGYKKQQFTSDDCPDTFYGFYIHDDEDPGNGTLHPSYLTVVTTKPWVPYGRQGWDAHRELSLISRKLLASEEFAEVRAATVEDLEGVTVPKGKYWLASPTLTFNGFATHCYLRYVDDGKIKPAELFCTRGEGVYEGAATINAGILAVVTLNTIIREDKPSESVPFLWN